MARYTVRQLPRVPSVLLAVIVCATGSIGSWNHSFGQFGGGGVGGDFKPPEVKSFSLEHANASDVANTLKTLFGDRTVGFTGRFAVDYASNRILVGAPEDEMHRIEEVLKLLDVAPAPKEAREVKVFPLRHAQAAQLAILLNDLVGDPSAKIAVDNRTNSILLSADPKKLDLVEALVQSLDQQPTEKPDSEQRLRVVWLFTGLPHDAAAPPEDLAEVVEELGQLGVRDLRMAAQTVLTTAGQQRPFRVECTALLGPPGSNEKPCTLAITGTVAQREGNWREVQLRLIAEGQARDWKQQSEGMGVETLCQLETTIRAPLNHFVVLGVTPIRKWTSAFVVQMMPAE